MRTIRTALLIAASLIGISQQARFYNEALGYQAFFYSAAAYCAYETLDPWDCGLPCQKNGGLREVTLIHNEDRNTFAYSGWNQN